MELRFIPVAHNGNQSESPEEANTVGNIVEGLLRNGTLGPIRRAKLHLYHLMTS
jgi:hypothetical protein